MQLVSKGNTNRLWLASTSNGSEKFKYEPSPLEIETARRATAAIGALYNEVDITFSAQGPVIIENNPTPNYVQGEDRHMVEKAAMLINDKMQTGSLGSLRYAGKK